MDWTPDLAVGVEEIDSQHRELFARIGSLVNSIKAAECKDRIDGFIAFLDEYARTHFAMEEDWMERSCYPEAQGHARQHHIFLDALASLKHQASLPRVKGASYDLSVTTNQVVVDWICSHILHIDMKFARYLKKRVAAAS